jgi:aspartate aminotransferase-like enzyme
MISLMPGPVEIDPRIQAAFHLPPISHRGSEFLCRFEGVRATLSQMTGARHVALFNGSGTLVNEAVASCLEGPGLVLVNGEFGARLAKQAARWNLPVRTLEWTWGTSWNFKEVEAALSGVEWVWAVHLETSTGMLNDIRGLVEVAHRQGVRVCLDCISSLGAANVDLDGVWLATGVSGKALGSIGTEGSCFTFPSPLLLALEESLHEKHNYAPMGGLVRGKLREQGIRPMVDGAMAAPIVTTFVPPDADFMERCRKAGFQIGGESGYLAKRGFLQIATMGAVKPHHIQELFANLAA